MMNSGLLGLDRRGDRPLYVQLRETLRADIRSRGLTPGDRLPTEDELEERYGVSRSTIRQAVGDLVAEGVVDRVQGKGTFVAAPRIQHVPVLTSFSELLRSQGYTPAHDLLESSLRAATPEVAEGLEIAEGAACRFLRRRFTADGHPVGVSETWLPLAVLGAHDAVFAEGSPADRSLYEVLEAAPIGLELDHAVETVNPGLATPEEAGLLGCEPASPLLVIRRITRTPEGPPVEWTRLLFVGGRYEYRVELHRPSELRR